MLYLSATAFYYYILFIYLLLINAEDNFLKGTFYSEVRRCSRLFCFQRQHIPTKISLSGGFWIDLRERNTKERFCSSMKLWWNYRSPFTFFDIYQRRIVSLFIATESSGSYTNTSKAFIFSLVNKEGLPPFKSLVRYPNSAILRSLHRGVTFGGGHDICIKDNANSNTHSYTAFGHSYPLPSGVKDGKTILAGTQYFKPDELEVFYLDWKTNYHM